MEKSTLEKGHALAREIENLEEILQDLEQSATNVVIKTGGGLEVDIRLSDHVTRIGDYNRNMHFYAVGFVGNVISEVAKEIKRLKEEFEGL